MDCLLNAALDHGVTLIDTAPSYGYLNLCDRRLIDDVPPKIAGKGFIAKRPSANHPWRFSRAPMGNYCEAYWHRWRAMNPPNRERAWGEVAIRFALSVPAVSSKQSSNIGADFRHKMLRDPHHCLSL